MIIISSVIIVLLLAILILLLVNWVWIKPKRIERSFREKGFNGNPYTFFIGDFKSIGIAMNQVLTAKPIDPTHDDVPRVLPFHHFLAKTYGMLCTCI